MQPRLEYGASLPCLRPVDTADEASNQDDEASGSATLIVSCPCYCQLIAHLMWQWQQESTNDGLQQLCLNRAVSSWCYVTFNGYQPPPPHTQLLTTMRLCATTRQFYNLQPLHLQTINPTAAIRPSVHCSTLTIATQTNEPADCVYAAVRYIASPRCPLFLDSSASNDLSFVCLSIHSLTMAAVDPAALQQLANALSNTLSDNQAIRTRATDEIRAIEQKPGSSILLLHLLTSGSFPHATRQSAAIAFKNFIMQHWDDEPTAASLLPQHDRTTIKHHIAQLMLSSTPSIQQQLSQVLALISKSDFPQQWETLLPDLTAQLARADVTHDVKIGCLSTLHSIFFRYRHEYKSEALWIEVKYVLDMFAAPLTALFTQTAAAILNQQPVTPTTTATLIQLFEELSLILDIFLSLNSQDIPEYFEDHMADWFTPFQSLLNYTPPTSQFLVPSHALAEAEDESLPDHCKSSICDILHIYAARYEEQFNPYVATFVQLVWTLVVSLSASTLHDHLVSTSIKFLTSIASRPFNKQLFAQPNALATITQQIIVPQIKLRDEDIEMFEDDDVEWVRRDIEGSDIDTRRRVTVDFIRGLLVSFESELTELMKGYVGSLIQSYNASPAANWRDKDAAIYIILALSSKSATRSRGITQTNPYIDLSSFFQSQILAELQSPDTTALPILKADAIRFIAAFRSQLSAAQLLSLLPLLINYVKSRFFVVHTYAAYAIERILTVKTEAGVGVITKAEFAPFAQPALETVFNTLETHNDSRENEYLMRCIVRITALAQESVMPYISIIIQRLTAILLRIAANPTHPRFNHAVFDTYASLISSVCATNPTAVDAFEQALFPVFQQILGGESSTEFSSYIFQLLALLLECRPDVSPHYRNIHPSLNAPVLYENIGNIPALTRLLCAYIIKQPSLKLTADTVQQPLAIFQKLLSNKRQHLYALDLLAVLVDSLRSGELERYWPTIYQLLFTKFASKPGNLFYGKTIVAFAVVVQRVGVERWLAGMNSVQAGIASNVLDRIVITNLPTVLSVNDRAVVGVSMADVLTSPVMTQQPEYMALLPRLLAGVVALVDKSGVLITEVRDDDVDESEAGGEQSSLLATGDQSAFSRLAHAREPVRSFVAVSDVRGYVAGKVREVAGRGDMLNTIVANIPVEADRQSVVKFMAENGMR